MKESIFHRGARIRGAISRYRDARSTFRTPSSQQSRHGLDWVNFFLADIQTGFGTFVAFYLARLGWPQSEIGTALGVDALTSVLSQIPGGAFADAVSWKRGLIGIGILMVAVAGLIFAFAPGFDTVLAAQTIHGLSAGVITPAIGAISLGLVGRRAMSVRTGRNYRFSAAGTALTAGLLGLAGTYFSENLIFVAIAALCLPALFALSFIRPGEIDHARARNAGIGEQATNLLTIRALLKNRRLLLFTACIVLFQFADASTLPLVSEEVAKQDGPSAALVAGLIIIPQIVVAMLAPWVGYHSERYGRRPLLLAGFALEPIRAIMLAVNATYPILIIAQLLNGIIGAIVTVLTVLIAADITTGTGRFNFARGAIGTSIGIAASISTTATGFIVQHFGRLTGFLGIAAVAFLATVLLWLFQPETKPAHYWD